MIDRHRRQGIKSIVFVFLTIIIFSAIATRRINISRNVGSLSETYKTFIVKPECMESCSDNYIVARKNTSSSSSKEACPEYFQWIHEDSSPWKKTGISREMVKRGRSVAHIRILHVKGRLYVERYKKVFQPRDVVTVWGIVQLLGLYPGVLPDFDLMFELGDKPVIKKHDYRGIVPPPVFHYCGNDDTFDIPFPDWSFWGWSEINVQPWDILKKGITESNQNIKWMDREPYAYWKGNTGLSQVRHDLKKCNASRNKGSEARIYDLDWKREHQEGYKSTNLTTECTHRYKIYIEGIAWSVSEKYILACDSMTLIVKPRYYDFYSRGLLPSVHYWPIREGNGMCKSINFAVKWGNKQPEQAMEIGKAGSYFVQEQLKMKHVYDYMFHILNQYAQLLKYQPTVPKEAVEVCSESMICLSRGLRRRFRLASKINSPSDSNPCNLQSSFDATMLEALLSRKRNLTKKWNQKQLKFQEENIIEILSIILFKNCNIYC